MKALWLKRLDDSSHRYRIDWVNEAITMIMEDGHATTGFELQEFVQTINGEWEQAYPYRPIAVSIETLLSCFVAENSENHKYITDLEEFKKD